MIDGILITYYTSDPQTHLLDYCFWEILVNEKSLLPVNEVRTATLRGITLKLKPAFKGGFYLTLSGSLHKYFNYGCHNTDQFTFFNLLQAISGLTNILGLNADECYLHGLEIGLNIKLPYPPFRILKNLVCYNSRPFTPINKRSAWKGLECVLTQYILKLYDKAKQSGIDCGHVLRFEVSVKKMQLISKYQITTLADLQNVKKVYSLINILKEAYNGIIFTDTNANLNRLSNREQKQWLSFSNPKTWQHFGKYQRSRALKKWKVLLLRYGTAADLLPLIATTWESLFYPDYEAEKPQPNYPAFIETEGVRNATFLPLECTVKRLLTYNEKTIVQDTSFSTPKNPLINDSKCIIHHCLSCGKDISNQRKNSKFCSETLNGKSGKRCRNKHSNQTRKIKNFFRAQQAKK